MSKTEATLQIQQANDEHPGLVPTLGAPGSVATVDAEGTAIQWTEARGAAVFFDLIICGSGTIPASPTVFESDSDPIYAAPPHWSNTLLVQGFVRISVDTGTDVTWEITIETSIDGGSTWVPGTAWTHTIGDVGEDRVIFLPVADTIDLTGCVGAPLARISIVGSAAGFTGFVQVRSQLIEAP